MGLENYVLLSQISGSKLYKYITILAAFLSAASGGFLLTKIAIQKDFGRDNVPAYFVEYKTETYEKVRDLQKAIVELHNAMDKKIPEDAGWRIEAAGLKRQSRDIQGRLSDLEHALIDTPAKALSVPLLRKEVESLERDVANSQSEIDRVYTIMMWIGGLMVTIALGTIGFVFSNKGSVRDSD